MRDNYHYVVLPTKTGFALVEAGTYSRSGDVYPGVVIVSVLDEAFTLDLFGLSGSAGSKNVAIAPRFDAKHAIKLPSSDCLQGRAPGCYQLVHRGFDGKPIISGLGYVEPPSRKR